MDIHNLKVLALTPLLFVFALFTSVCGDLVYSHDTIGYKQEKFGKINICHYIRTCLPWPFQDGWLLMGHRCISFIIRYTLLEDCLRNIYCVTACQVFISVYDYPFMTLTYLVFTVVLCLFSDILLVDQSTCPCTLTMIRPMGSVPLSCL